MSQRLRVAIVYDRVFPASFGGAERWFNLLATELVQHGVDVTILTADHWSPQSPPRIAGVSIRALCGAGAVWSGGQRATWPVANFGRAVFAHLTRHGDEFDVIHTTAQSPAAAWACVLAARAKRLPVVIDWWEVWSTETWRAYLGSRAGVAADHVLRSLARTPHIPVVYSRLHQRRLRAMRGRTDDTLLRGVLARGACWTQPLPAAPYLLVINRLIPEKQTAALLPALALARLQAPDLRAVIIGEGPEAARLSAEIARLDLTDCVTLLHGVPDDALEAWMHRALCVVMLSRREGYGLAVAEGMRFGVPALVLSHPESAAVELIDPGENGYLLLDAGPEDVASAILSVQDAGFDLRSRTLAWRLRHDHELSISASLPRLLTMYQQGHNGGSESWWRNGRP